ncbi:unnamed protein product [Spirodela intermedia]|uniref:Uncharacterized protein n=1 Tax=Spirodela intermedia TaxID=51605 RepID=A0A7I8JU31_SPIIN|nr:unnamed protein product [Spirodela intermedia]CAA6673614.1 unnamed protein product [Spirodela intermedia]
MATAAVRTSPSCRKACPFLPSATKSQAPSPSLVNLSPSAAVLGGAGLALAVAASACVLPPAAVAADFLSLQEPENALSLPTWAVHVSSVVEWVTAMVLVWEYGDKPGYESWKGLSWGMVPLLGGALCACTWHFFYNSESLEILVALQAALTVIGNFTMCIAAYRIYRSSHRSSEGS